MLRIMMLLVVLGVWTGFFVILGRTGSIIPAVLFTAPAWGLMLMAGLFERFNPLIGVPFLRGALWAGTYVEPKRIFHTCPTCGGRGRVVKEK